MDMIFNPDNIKPHHQIVEEYRRSQNVQDWLVEEVADFFASPTDSDITAIENACTMIEQAEESFDAFASSERPDDQLVGFRVLITRGNSVVLHTQYSVLPSPLSLLLLCSEVANEGDQISVTHTLAVDPDVVLSAPWPLGMYEAALMCTPNPSELSSPGASHALVPLTRTSLRARLTKPAATAVLGGLALGAALGALLHRRP